MPCFLFIFLGAPWVEKLRDNQALRHALTAIGASVTGVILNLAVWFALNTAFGTVTQYNVGPLHLWVPELDTIIWASVAISVIAGVLVFRVKLGTLKVLAIAAGIGIILALLGLTP